MANVYLKYASSNNLNAYISNTSQKEIEITIEGSDANSLFSNESGTHRIQRIPPTEKKGRVQTSIVNVLVITPEAISETAIDFSKIKWSYYKDSGKGGQKRNKTLSGVRIQYEDEIVECCETRSQTKNKELALIRLKERLDKKSNQKQKNQISEQHQTQNQNKGKRGCFHRSYDFRKDLVYQDGKKYSLSKFMKGHLEIIS